MREIKLAKEQWQYVFSPYAEPVCTVKQGEKIALYTEDAYSGMLSSEADNPRIVPRYNPQVGPVYVEGAMPGDTLKVTIHDIEFTRDFALSLVQGDFGGLVANGATRLLNEPLQDKLYRYEYKDGVFRRDDRLCFAADPFLGTIATAPELEAVSSLAPFNQGGNMDVPDVKVGHSIYLPVKVPGAYFYTGDCHGRQGQGELCGSALEISAKVTLQFDVIKGETIEWPRIESETHLMCVGSMKPMEDAARIAYYELVQWMVLLGWDKIDAYQALSQVGELYVGNMVDTVYSVVAKVDKRFV